MATAPIFYLLFLMWDFMTSRQQKQKANNTNICHRNKHQTAYRLGERKEQKSANKQKKYLHTDSSSAGTFCYASANWRYNTV